MPGIPLPERSEELGRIESALARAGSGSFLVVEGPAGIGKTAVLASARALAWWRWNCPSDVSAEAGVRRTVLR